MSALFPPWEAPPTFVPRPRDEGLAQRVSKLAEFVMRNGAQFQDLMRQKQQGNPEYGFLFGGEGGDYYRWVLYCAVNGLNANVPPPHPPAGPMPTPAPNLEALAASIPQLKAAEFKQILEGLTGTKESIKTSQRWFLQNFQHAAGLAAMMATRCQTLGDLSKVLHVVYLVSDILVHSAQAAATQPQLLPAIKTAFLTVLGELLKTCYGVSGHSEETKQRLQKICNLWVDRGVCAREELAGAEAAAFADGQVLAPQAPQPQAPPPVPAPAPPPMSSEAPWQMAPQQYQQQPPPPRQPGYDYSQQMHTEVPPMAQPPWGQPHMNHPGDASGGGVPPWGPPPGGQMPLPPHPGMMPPPGGPAPWQHQAGPAPHSMAPPAMMPPPPQGQVGHFAPPSVPSPMPPPPEERPPPVNSMCFPPGILPKLLKSAADNKPYAPLQLEDIHRQGLPEANEPDAYLKSRLDKFYAEIHDYHGSKTRSQILQGRGQDPRGIVSSTRGEDLRGETSATARPMEVDPSTGMRPDGSFSKIGGDRAKGGLGSHKDRMDSESDDVYNMYRRERSGAYHVGRGASCAARGGR